MSVQTQIERITEEVNDQKSLITQIKSALANKDAGGEGLPTQEKSVEITQNGTTEVLPDDGYALSRVGIAVNVPIPDGYIKPTGTLAITQNGEQNVRQYEKVNVNVPIPDGYIKPSGTKTINQNGTHDVTQYASVEVAVPDREIVLQDIEVTENGTYAAAEGYDGIGQVTVNVAASGGGSDLPAGYSRADYIEFTGEQLVDTRIIGNQDTQIWAVFTWGNDKQNHLFGCASPNNTASITSYMNGSWRFGNKSTSKTIQKNNTLLPYSVLVNKTRIAVTNSSTAISGVPDFETVGTLLLGGARTADGGLPDSGIVGRVLDFRAWGRDTPVMKMIPVTDGQQYRFWDAVSQSFFDSITDVALKGGNL